MYISKCCNAKAIVVGNTTHYYVCTQCEKSCDAIDVSDSDPKSDKLLSVDIVDVLSGEIDMDLFDECCKQVAKQEGIGKNLVTGHRREYFKKAAEMLIRSITQIHNDKIKQLTYTINEVQSLNKDLIQTNENIINDKLRLRKAIEYALFESPTTSILCNIFNQALNK